ncbi:MAG TPA: outer membrane lipid asymmetry maintenance protein MlaD [Rhodospirillaceae bacterium]|nr:outer membrane lipid asymmetry maintenance protein MlaD [Candidatus Neomarinimicrobiota bacterium]HCX14060.1 outer membrane lipid asymmetry maintenance protein MlaD [Rhodospirillaceae bacterium]|tara:strand:+ start:51 stop:509 length:459 start_codon:yes stop_codon:yes gene_type:complete
MKRNPIETVLGAVVLLVAAMFILFAYSTADLKVESGYKLNADFLKVGGLVRGSDVRISGVNVGTVIGETLNQENFQARITMSIGPDISLPVDTEASIVGDGLLGSKYVNLMPGQSQEILRDGETLRETRDYQSLEDLVGEIIFLATNNGDVE